MKTKKIDKILYAKELVVLSLTVCSIVFLITEEFITLTHDQREALYVFDVVVGLIFISEFIYELYLSYDKRYYIKHNWFYLLAAIPLSNEVTESLRALRLIRIIKFARFGVHYSYNKRKKK